MIRLIHRFCGLAGLGFAVIVLMMVYEVVARYGFGRPTFWAHEIAGLIGAIAFLLGGAFCMAEQSHMRINAFTDRFPYPLRKAAELLSLGCGTLYLSALCYSGFLIAQRSAFRFMPDGAWFPERSGSSWNTPLPAFIKVALFVSSVLFLAVLLRQLYRALTTSSIADDGDGILR